MSIHPTAVVSPDAKIGKNVKIGPYSVIEDNVVIGDDCFIDTRVKIARYTTIGRRCAFYMGALVGEQPQDHRWKSGIKSFTTIGDDCVIREYVTIHRPPFDGLSTVIGNNVLLMAFVHIAHDVHVGSNVTMANHTSLTGHIKIQDGATLSGYIKMHQFCRVGKLAFVAAGVIVTQDVPPFCMLDHDEFICGPNTVGLRRAGLDARTRAAIRKAIKIYFFKNLNSTNAIAEIEEKVEPLPEIKLFVDFIKTAKRGVMPANKN